MKKLLMIWAVLLGITCLIAGISSAATWTVCSSGCTSTTIQGAIDAVATHDGDTINVAAGTYNETVTVNKHLTIKGHSVNDTFVNAPTSANHGFIIIAPDVNLSGFTIRGGTDGATSGIIVGGTSWTDGTDYGVTGVVIQKCILERSCVGIMVSRSTGTKILNNTIRYCTEMSGSGFPAIYLYSYTGFGITDTVISHNVIYDNDSYGIGVYGNSTYSLAGLQITNNTLYNNGADDLTAPSNNNSDAMFFNNCTGPINVSNNKILVASTPGMEFFLGGSASGVTGTNNKIYPSVKPATLSGPAIPLSW
jgi:nitrous oxidase accessory protein NosD